VRVHWHRASFFGGRWDTIVQALTYLLQRYPEFRDDAVGLSRIYGQIAFAHGAAGRGRDARRWAFRALGAHAGQPRAYAALLLSVPGIRAEHVLHLAQLAGRGI